MSKELHSTELHSVLLIRIAKDEVFFGPGPCKLLQLIDKYHSVEAAAREMKMSYSKARNLIKRTEKELGEPVVIRHPGGHGGGSSLLTETGNQFLQCYIRYLEQMKIADATIFRECFAAYISG